MTATKKCHHRGFSKAEFENVENLYSQGYTLGEIAQKINVSGAFISYYLRKFGIKIRNHGESRKAKRLRIDPKWDGIRTHNADGYRYIYSPNHPKAKKSGFIPEHRLVWEKIHQKLLPEGWLIHHLNGIRNDNRPENLAAVLKRRHNPYLVGNHSYTIKQIYQKRIRELELEIGLLRRTLEVNQSIFYMSEN